jgi:glutamine synthetase
MLSRIVRSSVSNVNKFSVAQRLMHGSPIGGVVHGPSSPDVSQYYQSIPIPKDRFLIEYIWIGGSGHDLRSKTKTVSKKPNSASDLSHWNYDGSSTGQAPGNDSEVAIHPKRLFKDPFRPGDNFLVMCDTYTPQGVPIPTNTRHHAEKIFAQCEEAFRPMFAFEQEYSMFKDNIHLGWPQGGYPAPQGPYYCSAGANKAFGREVVEAHYRSCLFAGIYVSGINAEVMSGQWEYQVGPVVGLDAADQHWVSRYILHRVGEDFGIVINFDPKPMTGDWNGAGCHTNFCIKDFHVEGSGYKAVLAAIKKLEARHEETMKKYGEGNERRMTGKHETASYHKFTYGVANRGASIRIPRLTESKQAGYIEDRRPASNMDPYVVTALIAETICLK